MLEPNIIPTAEPFFFPGGSTGCLLVHGYTGAPKEMRKLGEFLASQGHTVLGIRLSGHATRPEDLPRIRWRDWIADVESGWHVLKDAVSTSDDNDRIFVIGLSMGGILSLLFSSDCFTDRYPLTGAIAMSTPYALRSDWRLSMIDMLHYIQPHVEKGASDWHDPAEAAGHVEYPVYPTRPIIELREMLAELRYTLHNINIPVLLMHGREDTSGEFFDPLSMEQIYAGLGTKIKQMLWVEDCGHNMPCDSAREEVFQSAAAFIERIISG